MTQKTRRTVLKLLGATTAVGGISTGSAQKGKKRKGQIQKFGHSLLSDPPGSYAEVDVRNDGHYAVLGSYLGEGGSFLVDIQNPTNPTEVHRIPSSSHTRNADVKFDTRPGLYYRSQEPNDEQGVGGVEVIDYGYGDATPQNPAVISRLEAGETHNLFKHPHADIVYTVNAHGSHEDEENTGFDIFDVSDPWNPQKLGEAGPAGALHDIVIDPDSNFMHCAYIGGALDGYVIMDVSNPTEPSEVGRFDYEGRPDYSEKRLENGEPGFESCHYANYDPERGLAVVGDEIGQGWPGGKHIFDIGWGDGSPSDPQHIGFTYSPDAEYQGDDPLETYDWTTHNHDIIPKGNNTLLIDGGYHEGAVVYDMSDPTDPVPTDEYETDDKADEANGAPWLGSAPNAWGADYNAARDLVVVSDMTTGIYTLEVTPTASKEI
ncbi:LVIVD repeat-containing protein [Halomicrococcus sp. NG-SE-24]|uniref:LVIVD repeat-containing protein n=1 Tax=Halomicrococcus sp. NG-SE-24 TaxID=3436928 RepID=UPI003D97DA50